MPLSKFDKKFIFKIKAPIRWNALTALPPWFNWLLQELLKLFPFDLEGFAHLFKDLHTRTTKQIRCGLAATLEAKDLLQLHTLESFGSILYINTGLLREKSHRKKLKDEWIYRTILKTRNPLRSLRGQFQLGLF